MKTNNQAALMAMAIQADSLPKLRDSLLQIVDEINILLADGRKRGVGKGPRKSKGRRKTRTALNRKASGKRGGLAKAKYLDKMPRAAMAIPGVSANYLFVPEVGVVSKTTNGKVRLLRLPKTRTWGVKDKSGNRYFLTVPRLDKKLRMETGF